MDNNSRPPKDFVRRRTIHVKDPSLIAKAKSPLQANRSMMRSFNQFAAESGETPSDSAAPMSPAISQLHVMPCRVKYQEAPLQIRCFLFEGLLTQLFLPFMLVYHCVANPTARKRMRVFVFPLGTSWGFMPLLWILLCGLVVATVLISSNPDWSKDVYLRQQSEDSAVLISLGEGALAISLWVITVLVGSIAISHQPLIQTEKLLLPFSDELRATTHISTLNPLHHHFDDDKAAGGGSPMVPATTNSPPKFDGSGKKEERSHSDSGGRGSLSVVDPTITQARPPKNGPLSPLAAAFAEEQQTHIPYDQVLFDEVPPIEDDVMLLYACNEFFEADRSQEPTLYEEEDRQLLDAKADEAGFGEAGSPRTVFGLPSKNLTSPGSKGRLAPHSFKFSIGETVKRNNFEPETDFIFGGDVGIAVEGTQVEIASRKWGPEDTQLYAVDGSEPSIWFALNDHFNRTSTRTSHSAMDVAVGSEAFFSSLSHRTFLKRFDCENGNYSSIQGAPAPSHPLMKILSFLFALFVASLPFIVRWFLNQPLQGQGSVGEWILVICSFLMTFLCTLALLTVFRATAISVSNFATVGKAFSTVCFNTHKNKWFPLLNLLEPMNVESWYFLRLHLVSVHPSAFQGRTLSTVALLMFNFSWGCYMITYIALSPDPLRVQFEGWVASALTVCSALAVLCSYALYHSADVNEEFRSHLNSLSLTKVMTSEEMCSNTQRRTRGEIATLIDAQGILDDVMFVLGNAFDPIMPLGLTVDYPVWRIFTTSQLLILVPLGLIISSLARTPERWLLPEAEILV